MKYFEALNYIKANGRLDGILCAKIKNNNGIFSCADCIIKKMKKKYDLINICHGLYIPENDLNSYYNVREEKLRKLLEL